MEWLYFDLIKVTDGYILFDVKYETALTEDGKNKVFQSYDEAEQYLSDSGIRGNVRNVIDPSIERVEIRRQLSLSLWGALRNDLWKKVL